MSLEEKQPHSEGSKLLWSNFVSIKPGFAFISNEQQLHRIMNEYIEKSSAYYINNNGLLTHCQQDVCNENRYARKKNGT